MSTFLACLITALISIIGTLYVERWYTKTVFERPQLHIGLAFRFNLLSASNDLLLRVKNQGAPMPDFAVHIFHSTFGTYNVFNTNDSGPLEEDQVREFYLPVFVNGKRANVLEFPVSAKRWFQTEHSDVTCRLVAVKTEGKILFESHRLGRALCRILADAFDKGELNPSGTLVAEVSVQPQKLAPWLLDRIAAIITRRKLPKCEL